VNALDYHADRRWVQFATWAQARFTTGHCTLRRIADLLSHPGDGAHRLNTWQARHRGVWPCLGLGTTMSRFTRVYPPGMALIAHAMIPTAWGTFCVGLVGLRSSSSVHLPLVKTADSSEPARMLREALSMGGFTSSVGANKTGP
jgi:hypothetical protein